MIYLNLLQVIAMVTKTASPSAVESTGQGKKQGKGSKGTVGIKGFPILLEHRTPLLFPVKSQEFEAMAKIVGRDEAIIIQHIEFLFHVHKCLWIPNDYITCHLTTPARYKDSKKSKSLMNYTGLSERTLHRRLETIRTDYRYKKATWFDPDNVDFEGKFYLTAYYSSDKTNSFRELRWYRNTKKLALLRKEINAYINNMKAKTPSAKTIFESNNVAGDLAGQLAGDLAGDLATGKHKITELQELEELNNLNFKQKTENKEPCSIEVPSEQSHSIGKNKPQVVEVLPCENLEKTHAIDKLESGCTKYDSGFDCYKKLMLHYYQETVPYVKHHKDKLDQLKKNFGLRFGEGFQLFMEHIFKNWTLEEFKGYDSICTCEYESFSGDTHYPHPVLICNEGGKVLLDSWKYWIEVGSKQ